MDKEIETPRIQELSIVFDKKEEKYILYCKPDKVESLDVQRLLLTVVLSLNEELVASQIKKQNG